MMTHKNKDEILGISPDMRAEWTKQANKRVGDAMRVINEMTAKYQVKAKESTPAKPATVISPIKFTAAQQMILMKIKMGRDERAA